MHELKGSFRKITGFYMFSNSSSNTITGDVDAPCHESDQATAKRMQHLRTFKCEEHREVLERQQKL